MSTAFTGAKRLREMLSDPSKIVVCPGVYDGLTARLALAAGAECLLMVYRYSPLLTYPPTHHP